MATDPRRQIMRLSGTSMATPVVAGAVALLLQANPSLTPSLVKALLMTTAQPIAGYNTFEQGAGALNLEGAVRLAKVTRQDLSASTALGAPLLTTSDAPTPNSTIASETFGWSRGVVVNHALAVGSDLYTKYQRVYAAGATLGDGAVEPGAATKAGTARLRARFAGRYAADFYRDLGPGLTVSSIGLGTYLGECGDAEDAGYAAAVAAAVARGVNLIDTAINYRCQRSERAVGRALRSMLTAGAAARDEVVVCTKGGYVPLDGEPPPTREAYQAYLAREYYERGVMRPEDVVAGGHCIAPGYLEEQLRRSRENLGVGTIDVYYVHNPEQQLAAIDRAEFRARLRAAFELLEARADAGEIGCYGCATWNGFRVGPDAREHLDLFELAHLAAEVGGDGHHFRVVQLPVNLAMSEAVRAPTQRTRSGAPAPLLQAAAELGISVVASASLCQAKLAEGLPAPVRDALPALATDAQRAIAFVRSLPGVTAALVGMKRLEHLEENLGAGREIHTNA
jgi:aryl-alcohol dehydrogenase-like predicted oxidoreductase